MAAGLSRHSGLCRLEWLFGLDGADAAERLLAREVFEDYLVGPEESPSA